MMQEVCTTRVEFSRRQTPEIEIRRVDLEPAVHIQPRDVALRALEALPLPLVEETEDQAIELGDSGLQNVVHAAVEVAPCAVPEPPKQAARLGVSIHDN